MTDIIVPETHEGRIAQAKEAWRYRRGWAGILSGRVLMLGWTDLLLDADEIDEEEAERRRQWIARHCKY